MTLKNLWIKTLTLHHSCLYMRLLIIKSYLQLILNYMIHHTYASSPYQLAIPGALRTLDVLIYELGMSVYQVKQKLQSLTNDPDQVWFKDSCLHNEQEMNRRSLILKILLSPSLSTKSNISFRDLRDLRREEILTRYGTYLLDHIREYWIHFLRQDHWTKQERLGLRKKGLSEMEIIYHEMTQGRNYTSVWLVKLKRLMFRIVWNTQMIAANPSYFKIPREMYWRIILFYHRRMNRNFKSLANRVHSV